MIVFLGIVLVGLTFQQDVSAQLASSCSATHRDVLGPYYMHGVPYQSVVCDGGPYLLITGTVRNTSCFPVAGATVEAWQADASRRYYMDRQEPDTCRGKVMTDPQGRYTFITVMPGKYGGWWFTRPAHVHFRVTAPGRHTLVTQLYFSGDSSLGWSDPCRSCGSGNPSQVSDLRAPSATERNYTVGSSSYSISEVAEWDIVMI